MTNPPQLPSESTSPRGDPRAPRVIGALLLLLGCLALVAPLLRGKGSAYLLGLVLLASTWLRIGEATPRTSRQPWRARALRTSISIVAGLLLFAAPSLVFTALALLLGLSWVLDGVAAIVSTLRRHGNASRPSELIDGLLNCLLGLSIALQWPVSGMWSLAIAIALRTFSSGWTTLLGRTVLPDLSAEDLASSHPNPRLGLPPHPELSRLDAEFSQAEEHRLRIDRYWRR